MDWAKISKEFNVSDITFEHFTEVDTEVEVSKTTRKLFHSTISFPLSDDDGESSTSVSVSEAKDAVRVLLITECSVNAENDFY